MNSFAYVKEDRINREKRSWNMSRIKGRNTKPEIFLRKQLYARGIRYRLHKKDLPGRPDLVLSKFRAVVFVHGCFWHLHEGCRNSKIPSTRKVFWKKKLEGNRDRDVANRKALLEMGWRVLTVWECSLHAFRHDPSPFIDQVIEWLAGNSRLAETTSEGELQNGN